MDWSIYSCPHSCPKNFRLYNFPYNLFFDELRDCFRGEKNIIWMPGYDFIAACGLSARFQPMLHLGN